MATEVKRRRGTTSEHASFTGAVAELTVDLTKDTVVVHDGATQGGFPLLREDLSNVPTTAPFTHITLDTAIFDTTYTETESETQGTLYWNQDEETLSLVTNGETIELGQKVEIHVKNQTGAQINKGEVVYASGTVGASGRILVTKMIADGTIAAKRVLGVAAENIANGADGKVIKFGKLRQINTSTFSDGDILWVSTTVAGGFQNTEPVQANGEIALPMAYVVYSSASVGEIFVRVTPIDENEYQNYDAGLADIAGLTPTDSNFIVGNGTNWVAESGATALASLGAQAQDPQLDDIAGLTPTDGVFIVGNGSNFVAESGDTARTSLGLGTGDSPTFSTVVLTNQADDGTKAVRADRNVSAGNGVTGGGDLTADRTITLGTPTTLTVSTTDAVTTNSHTHALDLSGRTLTIANDTNGVLTFDSNAQNLGGNRTWTATVALHASGQDGALQATDSTVYGAKTFDGNVFLNTKIESLETYSAGIFGTGTIYTTNQFPIEDNNISFFEVDNMRVRNELRVHIFKKDIVKASNAYLFITDSAEIAESSDIQTTADTFKVLDDTNNTNATFEHGDLLWAKNVEDDGSLQVNGVKIQVSAQPKYVWDNSTQVWDADPSLDFNGYTDEFASGTVSGGIFDGKPYKEYNIYEVTNTGKLNAGDTIVRVSDGSILNDASSQYSPFIDIYDGVNTWADFQNVNKTKVRLGNLAGVSNASGYGLYTQNAFLTGSLVVGDLTKVGQYMEFDGSTLTVKGNVDITGTTIFKSAKDGSTTPTNLNEATFIDGGTIVTNSITATEIDANTITANEIASGTITATEIDVADLFAQDATIAGTLTIGQGGSFVSNVINFDDTSFDLATSTLVINSANNKVALGASANAITIDGAEVGFIVDGNGEFKAYADANNYIRLADSAIDIKAESFDLETSTIVLNSASSGTLIVGADADNQLVDDGVGFFVTGSGNFRVGTIQQGADSYITFDGTTVSIVTDTFDLDSSTLVIDSATNSGKIALGATPPTGISSGSGIYFDGTGDALIGDATGNRIKFDFSASALEIQSDDFTLEAGDLSIDSANRQIQIADSTTRKVTINDNTGFSTVQTVGTGTGTVEINDLADPEDPQVDGTVEDTTPVVNVTTFSGDRVDFSVTINYSETALGTANTLVGISLELAEEGGINDYVEETFKFHRFTTTGPGSVTLSGSFRAQVNDLNPASGFGYRLRFYANEGGQREGDLDFNYTITIYNQETQINKGGFKVQSSPTNFITDEKIKGDFILDLPIVTGLTYDDLLPHRGKLVKYQELSDRTGTNPATGGSVTIKPYQIIQLDFTEV